MACCSRRRRGCCATSWRPSSPLGGPEHSPAGDCLALAHRDSTFGAPQGPKPPTVLSRQSLAEDSCAYRPAGPVAESGLRPASREPTGRGARLSRRSTTWWLPPERRGLCVEAISEALRPVGRCEGSTEPRSSVAAGVRKRRDVKSAGRRAEPGRWEPHARASGGLDQIQ